MNHCTLKGNLTSDPDIKVLDLNGKKVTVANATIAVNRFFKTTSGDSKKDTIFVPIELWDSAAEIIGKYFKKGDSILLEGSLKVENWEKDGKKMSKMKVRVTNFEKLYRASPKEPVQDEDNIVRDTL